MKVIVGIVLFVVWCALLAVAWWAFGPETFWQRLIMSFVELILAGVLGVVAFFIGMVIFDEIDTKATRKRLKGNNEQK